jgi:hypothetical protein
LEFSLRNCSSLHIKLYSSKRVVSEEYNVAKQVIAQTNVTVENSGSVINKDINLRGRHLIGWGC